MSQLYWSNKDPLDVIDYTVDWVNRLEGDTISTSTWTATTGLTLGAKSIVDSKVKTFISGGVDGTTYYVTNTIVTSGGRTHSVTVRLKVKTQ